MTTPWGQPPAVACCPNQRGAVPACVSIRFRIAMCIRCLNDVNREGGGQAKAGIERLYSVCDAPASTSSSARSISSTSSALKGLPKKKPWT